MAALSIVRSNRRLQLLRSAIVDRYGTHAILKAAGKLAFTEVLGIIESTRVCSSPRVSPIVFVGPRAH